ncbi:hypothetical protein OTU49_014755 [Cherax quadricarinatus]|uniref:C2H2-type domain-containing protein n=2 Tax=Cherax quadricarinatus TaxID=27406 RepID=A0AAW0VP95_CHEQU
MVGGLHNTTQIPATFKTPDTVNIQLPFADYEADCKDNTILMQKQRFRQSPGYSKLYTRMSHPKNHLNHHDQERTDDIKTQGTDNVLLPSPNHQAVPKDCETIKIKYACHIPSCTKDFTRMSHLRDHLQWHAGERRYVCHWHLCNKAFMCKQNLKRHLQIHTGEKSYQCQKCGKRFMRHDNLKTHIESHEYERMQPPFVCPWDLCKKEFTVNASLSRHLRSHTGVRPYQCVVCHKHFMWPDHLNRHMKTHTDQEKTAASTSLESHSFPAPPDLEIRKGKRKRGESQIP